MRIAVIGGSGHVGSYLVPRLVEAGHEVISLSRGNREPYHAHRAWEEVRKIRTDRETEESGGAFGASIRALNADVVVDMICFTEKSVRHLVEALKGNVGHFLHCGTIWVYGRGGPVSADETRPRRPLGEYGVQKAAIEAYLHREAQTNNFPATIVHPGHIVGPGWIPVNPAGNLNPEIFNLLANGGEVTLPGQGLDMLHHVHAGDVAQVFMLAIENKSNTIGESFNAVSEKALTLREYAEAVASWYGKTARLRFLPWEDWRRTVPEEDAAVSREHIEHASNCSIEKAKRLLGYCPGYSSLQAIREAVMP